MVENILHHKFYDDNEIVLVQSKLITHSFGTWNFALHFTRFFYHVPNI